MLSGRSHLVELFAVHKKRVEQPQLCRRKQAHKPCQSRQQNPMQVWHLSAGSGHCGVRTPLSLAWRSFVFGSERPRLSTIVSRPSRSYRRQCSTTRVNIVEKQTVAGILWAHEGTLPESTHRIASRRTFLGMLYDQSLGLGPCALPPPTRTGDLCIGHDTRAVSRAAY